LQRRPADGGLCPPTRTETKVRRIVEDDLDTSIVPDPVRAAYVAPDVAITFKPVTRF
jgi:hypothetical protein